MKKRYIRQVAGRLCFSRRRNREILRDLEEIFAAAQEHGEGGEQVLERLGTPAEYVHNLEMQLGQDGAARRQKRRGLCLAVSAVLAAVSLTAYALSRACRLPEDAIGFAQGSTDITVTGSVDVSFLLAAVGAAALIAAAVQAYRLVRGR